MNFGANEEDYLIVKYNNEGQLLWDFSYNSPADNGDRIISMAVSNEGGIIATGECKDSNGVYDIVTLKLDSSGNLNWANRYYGMQNISQRPTNLVIDQYDNSYVSTGGYDHVILKYDKHGNNIWDLEVETPLDSFNGAGFVAVLDNSIFTTTTELLNPNGYGLVTIKHSQISGISQNSSQIPSEFSLSQNYPNPFNPTTNIKFEVPINEFVILKIFNLLGQEAATLVNENLSAGVYEYSFDGGALPSGMYFYTIQAGDFIQTRKMMLIK